MCIGIPMQVLDSGETQALCQNGDTVEIIDMMLVGPQPVGTWVQVFLGAARECLSEVRALQIKSALQSLEQVMQGKEADVDRLFPDLANREPQLPPHLIARKPS